jgi:hypothetical protein
MGVIFLTRARRLRNPETSLRISRLLGSNPFEGGDRRVRNTVVSLPAPLPLLPAALYALIFTGILLDLYENGA